MTVDFKEKPIDLDYERLLESVDYAAVHMSEEEFLLALDERECHEPQCMCEQSRYWTNIHGVECIWNRTMYCWSAAEIQQALAGLREYHPDYLGNTEFVTNRAGFPTQFMWYSPWGEPLVEEHSGQGSFYSPYLFNAKELDEETGNYYYGARYYNPKTSIWLSVDPMASEAPGWTPYRFCFDNPVNVVDPTGLFEDHWLIDDDGNAILLNTDGEEIIINDQNITDYDFTGNEKAFSQINEHYGSEAGISSDASYPILQYDENGQLIEDNIPSDWKITKSPQALQAKSKAMSGEGEGIIGTLWDGKVYDKEIYKSNLVNSMVHEKKHLLQNKSSYSSFDELEAIMYQMKHSSWRGTTSGQKADIKAYGQQNYNSLKPYYETSKNGRAWLSYFKKNIGF